MTKSNEIDALNSANAYASIEHSFYDPWAKEDVELSFRFAKPTKTQIKRLSDTAGKNATQASRDLLLGCVHPEDKEALLSKMEDYPGIAISFSTALIKMVGITSDLGN
jgi:hypothetical protein